MYIVLSHLMLACVAADKTWKLDSMESDSPFLDLHGWRLPWLHLVAWPLVRN